MEKSSIEISRFLELSTSVIIPMLCRPEFDKYKYGTKYKINLDFVNEIDKYLEMKKIAREYTRKKFQKAQKKLYQWKRRLAAQKAVF